MMFLSCPYGSWPALTQDALSVMGLNRLACSATPRSSHTLSTIHDISVLARCGRIVYSATSFGVPTLLTSFPGFLGFGFPPL